MKKTLLIVLIFSMQLASAQNIGIGTNTPDSSALLELNSSSKGFLPPRMTTAQRNAIVNPAVGLQIYNTTTDCLEIFGKGKWHAMYCIPVDTTLITDIDGNSYPTVKICNQTWMAKNLDVARYRNGDIIPQVTDPTQWANLTTGAWCWYNNDSSNGAVYGRLYNWYAVNDPRGLAPEGWHVPSDGEWNQLVKCIDPNADTTCLNCIQSPIAGGKLKEVGTSHWMDPNIGASNDYQFTALPGGGRIINSNNDFYSKGEVISIWTSTSDNNCVKYREILNTESLISRSNGCLDNPSNNVKNNGLYVRCIKDAPAPSTLNNGLVAYYPFNGNANDESGNGNNGTVNGATLTTDRFGNSGKAYSFDGVNDYIASISNNLPLGNNARTISLWFYNDSTSSNSIETGCFISYGEINTSPNCGKLFDVFLVYGNNGCYINTHNYGNYISNVFMANKWNNVIIKYDGISLSNLNIFVNGQRMTDNFFNYCGLTQLNTTSTELLIGKSYNSYDSPHHYPFNGKIDDIRIYNRALTQEEISYLAGH